MLVGSVIQGTKYNSLSKILTSAVTAVPLQTPRVSWKMSVVIWHCREYFENILPVLYKGMRDILWAESHHMFQFQQDKRLAAWILQLWSIPDNSSIRVTFMALTQMIMLWNTEIAWNNSISNIWQCCIKCILK